MLDYNGLSALQPRLTTHPDYIVFSNWVTESEQRWDTYWKTIKARIRWKDEQMTNTSREKKTLLFSCVSFPSFWSYLLLPFFIFYFLPIHCDLVSTEWEAPLCWKGTDGTFVPWKHEGDIEQGPCMRSWRRWEGNIILTIYYQNFESFPVSHLMPFSINFISSYKDTLLWRTWRKKRGTACL